MINYFPYEGILSKNPNKKGLFYRIRLGGLLRGVHHPKLPIFYAAPNPLQKKSGCCLLKNLKQKK